MAQMWLRDSVAHAGRLRRASAGGFQAICRAAEGLVKVSGMDTVRLIDAVVRHTTAFIAQLSTSAGLRAPLAHVADQVFLELSKEIESQGVSRKVVASMFGMALRGYQRKVQRLSESRSHKGVTLWEALVEHLHTHGSATRSELDRRFAADGAEAVAAVLHDLAESGIVYCTGRGAQTLYGLSSEQDRERILLETRGEKLKMAVWYEVFRRAQTLAELQSHLKAPAEETRVAVLELAAEGLVAFSESELSEAAVLTSRRFVVPVGTEHGFEVAVFDHYRAVLDAIAAKLRLRALEPELARFTGGATLVFDLDDKHPQRDAVLGLLERVRSDVNALWQQVSVYNQAHPLDAASRFPVTFYFGQNAQLASAATSPTTPSQDQNV